MATSTAPSSTVRRNTPTSDYQTGQTFHVNTVEGFCRLFKASVRSTHVQISSKHMQRYLSEFTFRANHRERVNGMFDLLVGAL